MGQQGVGMGQQGMGMQAPRQRLDPDSVPSPVQVMEDDERSRSGVFQSQPRGAQPPLVTTDFFTQDEGNCNPRFMRSTLYTIPVSNDLVKQTELPIALAISPYATLHPKEPALPVVDLGSLGPVRCNRCKAYMCPYMQFIDGGRRFSCSYCTHITEVPAEYFAHLDHTGCRVDKYERPELCLGSYEYVVGAEYCKNSKLPKPPCYIFMLDVSYNSIKSGLVSLLCQEMKEMLKLLPKEAPQDQPTAIRVGFVTYAKALHFFNIKETLAQPQMMVVADVQDVFLPLLDGFFVSLQEAELVIDMLFEQIPQIFSDSRETEIVLGPVIQAGLDALKAAEAAGKLFIFHTSLPIAEAPGKLKNRDDRKLLGTDKEKSILCPQGNFYTKLAEECVAAGCCVDIFMFPNTYSDMATVGELCSLTGGQLYKYEYFQAERDGLRFLQDLRKNMERPTAFDAVMRVRTSTGIRATDFYGHIYMSNTTDVELAAVDSEKCVAVQIKHDDTLKEEDGAFVQCALLYTAVSGQRRLRVHNLALNSTASLADIYKASELDTLLNFFAKQGIHMLLHKSPQSVRDELIRKTVTILATYRKECSNPTSMGQLILPEQLKLMPVYLSCLLKHDTLSGGSDITTDERSWLMHSVLGMDVKATQHLFYPRLFPVHTLSLEGSRIPAAVRCSAERLQSQGVYLIENGLIIWMWVGMSAEPKWVQDVFGVTSPAQIDTERSILPRLDTPLNKKVHEVIEKIRSERSFAMRLILVRQNDKAEFFFKRLMVEDQGNTAAKQSYIDFLCYLHREIRNTLQ